MDKRNKCFVRNEEGNFVVGSTFVPRSVFFALEPSFIEVDDLVFMKYDGAKQRIVTNTNQYQIVGEWVDGERYISRESDYKSAIEYLHNEEMKNSERIKQAVEQSQTPRIKRQNEYPPIEDMVVALWENLVEKKTKKDSGIEQIQKLRKAIKAKYPTENQENAVSTDEEETN